MSYGGIQEGPAVALSLPFGKDAERQQGSMVITENVNRQRISPQRTIVLQQKEIMPMDVEELPEKQVAVALVLPKHFMVETVQLGKILFLGGLEPVLPAG